MKNTLFPFKKTRNEGIERYQKLDETERICLICVVITCQSMVGYHPSEKKQVNSIRSNIYWFLIDFHRILWSKSSIIYVTKQKKERRKEPEAFW